MAHQSSNAKASVTSFNLDQPKKVEQEKAEREPQSLEEALLGEVPGEDSY